MRFEDRELESGAESISYTGCELQKGGLYFAINYFANRDLTVPLIETLVFLGRNLMDGDTAKIYFQDVMSYFCGRRFEGGGVEEPDDGTEYEEAGRIYSSQEDAAHYIFDYEHALDELIKCSFRRRGVPQTATVYYKGRELGTDP